MLFGRQYMPDDSSGTQTPDEHEFDLIELLADGEDPPATPQHDPESISIDELVGAHPARDLDADRPGYDGRPDAG